MNKKHKLSRCSIIDPDDFWRKNYISNGFSTKPLICKNIPSFRIKSLHFAGNPLETLRFRRLLGKTVILKSHKSKDDFFRNAFINQIQLLSGTHNSLCNFTNVLKGFPYGISKLKKYFPTIISYRIDRSDPTKALYYCMPYYSRKDGWLNGKEFLETKKSKDEITEFIEKISYPINIMHSQTNLEPQSRDYYISRMKNFFNVISVRLQNDPDLKLYENKTSLIINKLLCRPLKSLNTSICVSIKSDSFWESVTPKQISLIDGDLFLENILYNHHTKSIKLIDVGHIWSLFCGDPIFDREKLWGSITDELGSIREGRFELNIKSNKINYILHQYSSKCKINKLYIDTPQNFNCIFKNFMTKDNTNIDARRYLARSFYAASVLPILKGKNKLIRYFIAVENLNLALKEFNLL